MKRFGWFASALLFLFGCAAAPRPALLSQADATRLAPRVQASEKGAPQAFLGAEDLWQQAQKAYENGDMAQSELLSEQAIAAYEHAVVLARLAAAIGRSSTASSALLGAQKEVLSLDQNAKELEVEVLDLEARAKVARDALPPPKSEPATPERERARQKAAQALLTQARLLCVSARLLDPGHPDAPKADLEEVTRLELVAAPAPIDQARRVRARCLQLLSEVRRPKVRQNPQGFAAEGLLTELSEAKFGPFRDDRGVVVTLREVFGSGNLLAADTDEKLAALGRIAKAHPEFPVLVVLHTAGDKPRDGGMLLTKLNEAGASNVTLDAAGSTLPVAPQSEPGAAKRNERVEIVFVSPSP